MIETIENVDGKQYAIQSVESLTPVERKRTLDILSGTRHGWKKWQWYKVEILITNGLSQSRYTVMMIIFGEKITFSLPRDVVTGEMIIFDTPAFINGIKKFCKCTLHVDKDMPKYSEVSFDYPTADHLLRAVEEGNRQWNAVWGKIRAAGSGI